MLGSVFPETARGMALKGAEILFLSYSYRQRADTGM